MEARSQAVAAEGLAEVSRRETLTQIVQKSFTKVATKMMCKQRNASVCSHLSLLIKLAIFSLPSEHSISGSNSRSSVRRCSGGCS